MSPVTECAMSVMRKDIPEDERLKLVSRVDHCMLKAFTVKSLFCSQKLRRSESYMRNMIVSLTSERSTCPGLWPMSKFTTTIHNFILIF